MKKLILRISLTLDGFVCGPNGETDWMFKSMSEDGAAWTASLIAQAGAHLVGRKTFTQMASYWPTAQAPAAKPMNEIPKFVFSKSGFAPSTLGAATDALKTWVDATVIVGDLADEIKKLKAQDGKPLIAHGGASFAQALVQTGLIDEYWLVRHPIAIGHGKNLFAEIKPPLPLKLIETKTFSTGTVAQNYQSL